MIWINTKKIIPGITFFQKEYKRLQIVGVLIGLVGAISLAGTGQHDLHNWLAVAAVALATINVVGGYLVTDRMLAMFKKKGG